jgi:tetratricopeptide (TPR) repeat protein
VNATSARQEAGQLRLARNLYDQGRYADAEKELTRILATGVASAAAYLLLADIRRRLNQPSREAHALERALAAGADAILDHPEAVWTRLGVIRASQGDTAAAVAAYEQAALVAPGSFDAAYGIATSRLKNQDFEEARQRIEDLQRRFPDVARTHLIAGHVHKAFGDVAEANSAYSHALQLEPHLGEALYNLVDMEPPAPDDAITARAREITTREDVQPADRINAGFALARIYDKAGRYAEAFVHVQCANRLAHEDLSARNIRYRRSATEQRIARIIADYPAASFRAILEPLPIDLTPIFVVGLPRSGTTLIEQILASNGDVQAAGERLFAARCEAKFREARKAAGREGPVDPGNGTDAELLEAVRERYVEDLFEAGLDGPWVVDKLPANFEIAGFLRSMFPQAPIIHSMRDPRATCFSLYWANFSAHEPWYHDLGELAHYCAQYHRLMTHWREVIPGPFIDLLYEDLVRRPETRIASLLHDIGLEFDPACIKFHEHDRPILTASHTQVRRPMSASRIDHWRCYAEWIGPLLDLQVD